MSQTVMSNIRRDYIDRAFIRGIYRAQGKNQTIYIYWDQYTDQIYTTAYRPKNASHYLIYTIVPDTIQGMPTYIHAPDDIVDQLTHNIADSVNSENALRAEARD